MRAKGISPLGPGRAQQGAGPSHLLQGRHHPWGPVTLEELFRVGMALTSEVRENAPPQAQQKESGPHQAGGSGGDRWTELRQRGGRRDSLQTTGSRHFQLTGCK